MTDPVNYEEIVWNIRADAAKISGARNDAYALTQPAASAAPTFDEYSKSLGYQNLDYEAKNQVQQSWLAQHGSTWKQAGANPEADLASFAKNDKPKFEITNTDWIDRFAQAAIQSGASQFNVIANEMQPGVIKDFLSNRGQQGLLDAKAIEQKFSPLTLDTMKKEARVAAELDKKYGGNIPATEEVKQALANIGGDPIGRIASAAGSSVTQFPGMAIQAAGGALAATGVGVGPGAALIAGGKVLSTALGASSVAGEVGQGAFDEVMKLTPKQLYSHPTFQAALSEAKKVGLSEDSANLAAQRAVASEAMSFGARMGATVGAVGGAVSANLGTGAIAQQAGKQAAKHFLKHAGIEMATEGVEGAITQVAQNKAAQSGGVDVALGKGVIAAGIEEAYGGLGQSAAASGIGKTVGALADIAKATPVKAPDVVTAPTTTPETLAKRMEHMPEYVKTMAEDLVNTIVATPNPTPEVKAEIDAAKSALLGLGFTQADLDGLYGTTVKADAVVSPDKTVSPVVNPGNPEQVTVGSYKPAETGGEPGTQAPTRLVTELAAQGPITLESINQKAVDHEKGYSGWVQSTQSEPSRVPKQEFISGTADNMVLTALQLGLPMDQAAQSYAQELQSTQATGSGNNSASNLGSRLTVDGKSLVSESDYQASQLGTVPDLVGKYVLYGNAEGYVVQRPQGLYVVDTRPGNTQDIFIEGGESQSTPAQLGVQLLSTPTVRVPTKRQGSGTSVSQQVETAQLTYDQILFNDALDLLVMSMEPAQAEAVLTAIDARLGDGATTAQVAKEIENAINKFDQQGSAGEVIDPTQNTQFTSEGFSASSSTDVSPGSKNGLAETANQIKTRHTIASTRAKLESWLYGLDPKLEGKTLDEMLPDVMLLENLPDQVIAGMEDRKIKTGLPFQDAYGVDTENVKDQAVNGFRDGRRGITVLFTKNMNVDADPISTLIHETWHKFQGRESDGGIIATANSWANKPAGSVENTAYLNGLQATQGTDITKGQQEFIPYILNSLWEQGVRPGQGTEASGWVDKALAYLQKLVDYVVIKATENPRKLTPQELMDIAVGLIRDDANGVNINKWLGPKEKILSQPSFSVADRTVNYKDISEDGQDYSMFTPNQPKTLSEKLDVINSGRLKTKVPDWQQIKDKTAEYLVDVSRPFDVWARSFGSAADQARLLQNKTLAKTRAGALTSEIDAKFSQPLAKSLQNIVSAKHAADISAAKEMVGEWMTVRYAQIKNADFITQDQQAVDDASPGSFEHQDALDKQAKRLAAINSVNDNLDPTQTQLDAGVAGGYNNATAAKVQSLIEAKVPVAMLEAAAQPVYDMLKYKATLDIKTGKTAVSQSVKWLNSPYYVPLTGDPRNDDSTSDVFGTGSLNQGKDKKAVGRTGSLAQNGIDAAYEQIAKSTNYHGWLPFKQELTSTYEKLMADAGGDAEKVWKDSGIKRFRGGPGVDIQNSIVVRNGADVTKNGSGWVYTLDSQDAIDGLRRVNLEEPNSFLAAIGWGTTIMSKMVTMWMPGFAVINSWRDGPERFTNLWTRTLANYPDLDMGKVALQATGYFADPRTLLTTRVVVAEKLGMFEWSKALSDSIPDFTPGDSSLLSEMLKAGASSTTGSYLSRDSSQLAEKLAKINRWDTKTKNLLVIWNDSFELKAPFAMYKALRNNGVDEKAAAATVLATMDFGKTGRAMAPIKALYMFAQPIATGSHQLFLTAGTTKGQVAGVAMLAASMGLYAMLSEMGGEDELLKKKKLDELGSFTLERSIPVPIGNNTYLKVPVPFGLFQLAWASGVNLMRGITGVQTPVETVGELLKLGVKTFAPVSPSEVPIMRDPATWFMQTLAPSFIGKTIVNVASNKTAFGGTLDNRANVKPGEPMWKMARKDTPELYVSASKWLLQNFNVNTSPEVIHEWLKGLTPGVLNEGTKAYIDNPAKDARGVPHVNQWFDRYLVQQTDSQFIDRLYYKAQAEVLDLRLKKNSDTKSAGNPLTEKENQLNAALRGDDNAESNIRKQWGALRKQNNEGLLTPEQYKTRYQQLDKQETDARRRFLARYNELTK